MNKIFHSEFDGIFWSNRKADVKFWHFFFLRIPFNFDFTSLFFFNDRSMNLWKLRARRYPGVFNGSIKLLEVSFLWFFGDLYLYVHKYSYRYTYRYVYTHTRTRTYAHTSTHTSRMKTARCGESEGSLIRISTHLSVNSSIVFKTWNEKTDL